MSNSTPVSNRPVINMPLDGLAIFQTSRNANAATNVFKIPELV